MEQDNQCIIASKDYLAISKSDSDDKITFTNNNYEICFSRNEFQDFSAGYFDNYKNRIIGSNDSYSFDYGKIRIFISPEDMDSFNSIVCKACRRLFGLLPSRENCPRLDGDCKLMNDMMCIKNLKTMSYFKCFSGNIAVFTKRKCDGAHFENMSDDDLPNILKTLRRQGHQVIPLAPEKNQKKYALT